MYNDSTHGAGISGYIKFALSYRSFLFHLVGSDLRARFRRTYLGILWALILPLGFASMLAFLFSNIFKQPWQEMVPYLYSGMILWEFITNSALRGADSFTEAAAYIKQSRLPVIIFPIRVVFASASYFFISLIGLLLIVMFINITMITVYWFFLPLFLLLLFYFTMPFAIICAFINISFRDFHPALGVILQFLAFASPIFIPKASYLSPGFREFSELNPVFALCNLFREPLLYAHIPATHDILVVLVWGAIFWIFALLLARTIDNKIVYYL